MRMAKTATMSARALAIGLALIAALCGLTAGEQPARKRINVVLLGATGNLAEKYLWQGLFNIDREGLRGGEQVYVFPAATKGADKASPILERILADNITSEDAAAKEKFLTQVAPYAQLRSAEQYEALGKLISETTAKDGFEEAGRLFYLSVPPKFFGSIAENINKLARPSGNAWLRVIVEKPFGVDLGSAEELAEGLYKSLDQEEILLVDHYMGKEGLHSIRDFARKNDRDALFASKDIKHVEVGMLETDDCKGRTGFYDEVGVLRDTMQNHLMMMVALLGMDQTGARDDALEEANLRKRVFEKMSAASLDRLERLGQYAAYNNHVNEDRAKWNEAPLEKPSRTPTYAHVVLHVEDEESPLHRVPLHFKSGKALSVRRSYVDVEFQDGSALVFNLQGPNRYGHVGAHVVVPSSSAELVFPDGWLRADAAPAEGDLVVAPGAPFAYQVLLRASLEGDKEHFVRLDEVLESWRVWTPLLEALEGGEAELELYEHGAALHESGKPEGGTDKDEL